jgi:hypothetical protein
LELSDNFGGRLPHRLSTKYVDMGRGIYGKVHLQPQINNASLRINIAENWKLIKTSVEVSDIEFQQKL